MRQMRLSFLKSKHSTTGIYNRQNVYKEMYLIYDELSGLVPTNYLFKGNNKNPKKGVKYFQS